MNLLLFLSLIISVSAYLHTIQTNSNYNHEQLYQHAINEFRDLQLNQIKGIYKSPKDVSDKIFDFYKTGYKDEYEKGYVIVFDRYSSKIGYSLDGRKISNTILSCKVMELKKILNKKHDNDSLSTRINRYLTIDILTEIDQRCFRRSLDDQLGSQIIILVIAIFIIYFSCSCQSDKKLDKRIDDSDSESTYSSDSSDDSSSD